jgi:hypothetical protein
VPVCFNDTGHLASCPHRCTSRLICCQTHDVYDLDTVPPPPLHEAVLSGLPVRAVEERIRESADVDLLWSGRTALWDAVMHRHHEIARVLTAAGADPWRPLIGGWSPGRLALAGPEPALFGPPPPDTHLTPAELTATARAQHLIEAVGDLTVPGLSIACLTRVDSAEATGRLRAAPIEIPDFTEWAIDPWSQGLTDHEVEYTIGASDVPGGCVLTQWAGPTAGAPGVLSPLTRGTTAYALYADPDHGIRGTRFRNGRPTAHDLSPGSGHCVPGDPPDEVLRAYLYYQNPIPYCCDAAALTPADAHPFTGPPDHFLRLPPVPLWPAA